MPLRKQKMDMRMFPCSHTCSIFLIDYTHGVRPHPAPARCGLAGSGTRCCRVWYKVWQGLVQGGGGSGTRCATVRYKVWHSQVQGVTGSGIRCARVWYKVCIVEPWGPWMTMSIGLVRKFHNFLHTNVMVFLLS